MRKPKPARAVHPGRVLSRELDARGWSKSRLAKLTGLPLEHITSIIDGEMDVTPEIADAFARAFGVSSSFWQNLQRNYTKDAAHLRAANPPAAVSLVKAEKHERQKVSRKTKAF